VAWLVWVGLKKDLTLAWLIAPMALIAFIGVARWVPFHGIPARLLFLFPFYLILLVTGREAFPRAATAILALLALLSCAGVQSYFERSDFLNKGYAMPYREMAAHISRASAPGRSLVVVDATPGLVNDRLGRRLNSTRIHETREGYSPFSPLQRHLAYRLGMPSPPSFFAVLLDLRR